MNTAQKARNFYNQFSEYDSFQKSVGWMVPTALVNNLRPHLASGELVLDVGCGPGMVGVELEKSKWQGKLLGVDIAEERLKEASKRSSYFLCMQADAYYLSFEDHTFDVVLSSAMVGLTGVKSVQEMLRVLKPGGLLACVIGELKNRQWCRKRFREVIGCLYEMTDIDILVKEDLGSGWRDGYGNEHYIYYLIRKSRPV